MRRSAGHPLGLATALSTLVLGLWLLPGCAAEKAAGEKPAGEKPKVLAVVGGSGGGEVTQADVEAKAGGEIKSLRQQCAAKEHELTQNVLQALIEERLVAAEAAARGISRDQLLAEIKAAPVTDAQVDAFYEQNKARIPNPKEQVAGQIRQYLSQQRQAEARQGFFAALSAKHKVDNRMEPYRVEVAATGPAKGPSSAPVTLVEFSDFQCPACALLRPTIDQVADKYGDKVRVVYRQFPLNIHPQAPKAAEASLCANEQGKFWELHDAMFGNQQALGVDQLKASAASLGLKGEAFNACLDSGKYAAQVTADFNDGLAAGVNSTPSTFVNGRLVKGAADLAEISRVIDDELRRKGG
jgi:protein-disulfide isomerase